MSRYNNLTKLINSDDMFMDTNSNKITYNLLDNFINKPFPKKSVIEIYGDSESGKTLFAKNLFLENKDKTFIYIDTFSQFIPTDKAENMFIMSSNILEDICELISSLEKGIVDCIVVDTMSNLTSKHESFFTENRHTEFLKMLDKLILAVYEKNSTLILLNTVNGAGESYYNSYQFQQLVSTKIHFKDKELFIGKEPGSKSFIRINADVLKNRYDLKTNIFLDFEIYGGSLNE